MSTLEPEVRPLAAIARAMVLGPLYFVVLTLFGIWPWRFGSPFFLVKPLRIQQEAQRALVLRLLAHRFLLRDDKLLRKPGWCLLHAYRMRRWLRSPWFVTLRSCARFTRREMERTGRSGTSVAISIYCDALVDSYRYANGTVHRDWFDLDRREDAAFHLPNEHHIRVCCYLLNHKLNPEMPLSQRHYDKSEFHRVCRAFDLPSIPVYAEFEGGRLIHQASVPNEALISKPADLAEGNGVFSRWIPVEGQAGENRLYRGDDGESRTLEAVFEELKTRSESGPYLLQRRVSNHQDIRDLAGVEALCTLRVPTCCFPDGEVVVLPFAFVRIATSPDVALDNWMHGSVAYPLDLETGCLTAGKKYGSSDSFAVHPSSGKRAVGFELVHWQDSVELCKRAHATAFSSFPSVGWDVAITPDGPLLLEMNIQWVRPVGLPDEEFSGKTAYLDCMLSHMRRFWPEQMPSVEGESHH